LNTAVKIGLSAAAIGAVVWIAHKASETLDAAKSSLPSLKITDFGMPKLQNNVLIVPLRAKLINPTQYTAKLDRVTVELSFLQKNAFVKVGEAQINDVSIAPGETNKDFNAEIDLRTLTSKLFDTITTIFLANAVNFKIDVTVVAGGLTIPTQSVTKTINLV
jgi:hypothetical protein